MWLARDYQHTLLIACVVLGLASTYLYGINIALGAADDLAWLILCFVSILYLARRVAEGSLSQIVFLQCLIFCIYLSSYVFSGHYSNATGLSYELYKLVSVFLPAVLFVYMHPRNIEKLLLAISNILFAFLLMNSIIIFIQYAYDPRVVLLFGIGEHVINSSMRVFRWSGLIENPNVLGVVGVALYLIQLLLGRSSKTGKYFSMFIVLISTSKSSMLALIILVLIEKAPERIRPRDIWVGFSAVLFSAGVLFYVLNLPAFQQKIPQARYVVEFLLHNNDKLNRAYVDDRFYYFLIAIDTFRDNFPFGAGLATWGDASSRFDEENFQHVAYTDMADSAFSHYLAEQGVGVIVYFFLIFLPFFFLSGRDARLFLGFFIFYLMVNLFSMGMSGTGYPLLLGVIYWSLIARTRLSYEDSCCQQYVPLRSCA